MSFLKNVRIVVRQLLTWLNVAKRLNPDSAVFDHRVAIWVTRMVDEPGLVAIHRRIDHDVVVDREEVGVVPLPVVIRVFRIGLRRGEALTGVFDKTCS